MVTVKISTQIYLLNHWTTKFPKFLKLKTSTRLLTFQLKTLLIINLNLIMKTLCSMHNGINPKKINFFKIFCKFLSHKGTFCWKVPSKNIYTFYLKHQKYPFCAPIFHPLSETESHVSYCNFLHCLFEAFHNAGNIILNT